MQIERALEEVERVLSQVNEAIRDQEGRERLKAVSANLWIGQGYMSTTLLIFPSVSFDC